MFLLAIVFLKQCLERGALPRPASSASGIHVIGLEAVMRPDPVRREDALVDHLHHGGPRHPEDAGGRRGCDLFRNRTYRDGAAPRHHVEDLLQDPPNLWRQGDSPLTVALDTQNSLRSMKVPQHRSRLLGLMRRGDDATSVGADSCHDGPYLSLGELKIQVYVLTPISTTIPKMPLGSVAVTDRTRP